MSGIKIGLTETTLKLKNSYVYVKIKPPFKY
jgi:hypothetical protein